MTLLSMTGFGDAAHSAGEREIRVTLRSVNHRQLDVRIALPAEVSSLEPKVASCIKAELRRGRVDVRIHVAAAADQGQGWDRAVERLKELATTHGLGPVSVSDVLRFSQLVTAADDGPALEADAILACVSDGLRGLQEFRTREGRVLQDLFEGHTESLTRLLDAIEGSASEEIGRHRERITARVADLLGDQHSVDGARIEQEVVLLAERSDIAEEVLRAREHVRALRSLVADPEGGAKGKRLDFLLQELIRETNTMASKSISAAVTHRVVEAKTLIEQLREQALNVE